MYTPITARELKVGDSFTYNVRPGEIVDRVDQHLLRDVEGVVHVQLLFIRDGKATQLTVPAAWGFYRVDPDTDRVSDIQLAADIELLERRIGSARASLRDTDEYVALVTERHARTMARGKSQAAELERLERKLAEIEEEN